MIKLAIHKIKNNTVNILLNKNRKNKKKMIKI